MWHIKKYLRIFTMGIQSGIEYRGDFILSIFSGFFVMIIQCCLWTAIFQSSETKVIYGYNYAQMISYLLITTVVSKIVATGFEWEIADDIKNGGLNKFIAQPINYFHYRIFAFLGRKVSQVVALIIFSSLILLGCSIFLDFDMNFFRIGFSLIFIVFALIINFLIYYILSTLAFVISEVWGIYMLASQSILFFSGGIFPLDVFSKEINTVFSYLPFQYIIYFPVNIINGRFSMDYIVKGAIVEIIWILILYVISNIMWRVNMKKYIAIGG